MCTEPLNHLFSAAGVERNIPVLGKTDSETIFRSVPILKIARSFVHVAWLRLAKRNLTAILKFVGVAGEEDRLSNDMRQLRKGQSLEQLLHRSSSHSYRTIRRLRLSEISECLDCPMSLLYKCARWIVLLECLTAVYLQYERPDKLATLLDDRT
jgi:hypothetical protein